MLHLPDVNIWVALTFDSHPNHPAAKLWFDAVPDTILFCRMTQQGFLRLVTNPSVGGPDVLTMTEAWQKYDEFLSDPRIMVATEPAGLETQWRSFTQGKAFSPKVWNDAYLAAFAKVADYEGRHSIGATRSITA
jgi:toxin-antitoxin system PIN domain toxin